MKRPLAYVTAAWCGSDHENAKLAAQYCRTVYEAGFSPICPTLYQPLFLNDAVPEEHKSGIDIDLNVFEAVKQSVTTRQAAEHYGIRVGRNGMACCPFHNDKTPSMKLDRRYHCFGCGADGDVIDFTAVLYGLGKKEAAVQLAQDFGISYEDWKPPGKVKKPKPRQKSPEEQFQEAKSRCFRILADYLHLLRAWRKDYVPHSPEEAVHPRFVEALQKQAQVEYLLDVLLFGETEEKAALITDYGKDVIQLEQRMAELAAADAARTKKHHERHAAAPEH